MNNKEQILIKLKERLAVVKSKKNQDQTNRILPLSNMEQTIPGDSYVTLVTLFNEEGFHSNEMAIIGYFGSNIYYADVLVDSSYVNAGCLLSINATASDAMITCELYDYNANYVKDVDFINGHAEISLGDTGEEFYLLPKNGYDIRIEFYPSDTQIIILEPTHIAITKAPDKTVYFEGQKFDPAGMEVTLYYGNRSSEKVTNYTYSPTDALQTSNDKITVSFNGFKATYQIEVKELYPYVETDDLPGCDYLSNPKINLATGKLLYVVPDISLGINSYTIALSHVYNSKRSVGADALYSIYGNGWKLNIDLHLLHTSINGKKQYKYVDESGYVHEFVNFDDNRYYDTSDASIVLEEVASGADVKDSKNNIIHFNKNGRVEYTQSGMNGNIKKVFSYENDRLIKIYDERKSTDYLQLTYGESGMLAKITKYHANDEVESVKYFYDNNKDLIQTAVAVGN